MHDDRPEKMTIRDLWVTQATDYLADHQGGARAQVPLYLTLSGAEGRDIQRFVDAGLIRRTEVGGIATEDQHLVVAVESSPGAELALRRKFPGLRTYGESFHSLIRGTGMMSFPEKKLRAMLRASIINLDLTTPLDADLSSDGRISFPVLTWIRKLCEIHSESPRLDWCLCLTLNGDLNWPPEVWKPMQEFLAENFNREPRFGLAAQQVLGGSLYAAILACGADDLSGLSADEKQKLLMVFVPKKITQLVHAEGWRLRTPYNLRYGGHSGFASMVTWVFGFTWDRRSNSSPFSVYRDSLNDALTAAGHVDARGRILTI
jgi:hypothetical protein